jgi:hypothetical protein
LITAMQAMMHFAALLGDVVFARAAGVFGHVARQQVDVVAHQAAHLVLGVVRLDQLLRQVERGRAAQRGRRLGRRRGLRRQRFDVDRRRGRQLAAGVDQEQEFAQAVDALAERDQQVGQRHAGAGVQGAAADLQHHVLALVEHHQQVLGVVDGFGIARQQAAVIVEVFVGFDVLHQEGRVDFLDFHVGVDQARLQAERAHAAGQRADRVEQAGNGHLARAILRCKPFGIGRRRGIGNRVEQLEPVGVRHGADPLIIGLAAQHAVERVGQVELVERGRQDAIADAALQLGKEAVVGQDADVGIQARMAARFEQAHHVVAQRPGLGRIALEQLRERAHLRARVGVVAHAVRADLVDQVGQQVDAVAVGIEAF